VGRTGVARADKRRVGNRLAALDELHAYPPPWPELRKRWAGEQDNRNTEGGGANNRAAVESS
jgi:hypothetical protein